MKQWAKDNPLKAAGIGLVVVAFAAWLFGPETAQGWIEAIWTSQQEPTQ